MHTGRVRSPDCCGASGLREFGERRRQLRRGGGLSYDLGLFVVSLELVGG